jgi:DNA-binding MarR family transcriptional regulator
MSAPPATAAPDTTQAAELELAARLRTTVGRLSRLLRRHAGTGLPLSLQSALATIADRGPVSLGDLAAIEQIAPPTVTKFVGKLEEEGLVERRTDTDDRRVTLVSVTRTGRHRLEQARRRRDAWLAERLAGLGADDLERLASGAAVLEALVGREATR